MLRAGRDDEKEEGKKEGMEKNLIRDKASEDREENDKLWVLR